MPWTYPHQGHHSLYISFSSPPASFIFKIATLSLSLFCGCGCMGVANDSHMALINWLVYCKSSKKTLVPWRISSVNLPKLTFHEYYYEEAKNFVAEGDRRNRELDSVYVGKSKDECDGADINLSVLETCHLFGPYIKFFVTEIGGHTNESKDFAFSKPILNLYTF